MSLYRSNLEQVFFFPFDQSFKLRPRGILLKINPLSDAEKNNLLRHVESVALQSTQDCYVLTL